MLGCHPLLSTARNHAKSVCDSITHKPNCTLNVGTRMLRVTPLTNRLYLYRRYAHANASVTQSQTNPRVTQLQRKGMTCISMKNKLLGVLTKLQKATVGFIMSVCLSVRPPARMEQLGSHWTDFHASLYLCIF